MKVRTQSAISALAVAIASTAPSQPRKPAASFVLRIRPTAPHIFSRAASASEMISIHFTSAARIERSSPDAISRSAFRPCSFDASMPRRRWRSACFERVRRSDSTTLSRSRWFDLTASRHATSTSWETTQRRGVNTRNCAV